EGDEPRQRVAPPRPYQTLRQLEEVASAIAADATAPFTTDWGDADPGIYLARTAAIAGSAGPLHSALDGARVTVVPALFVHRFASMRGQLRGDLLEIIPSDARSILEFGCGEGALAEALKLRQRCRVVGVELDPEAEAAARARVDRLIAGDVRKVVDEVDERFDWIIGGDILEHLDEPWTFLQRLRRLAAPGGHLLLSLPNVSSWPVVSDLLRGRFDYVYMGILCAGHLRFFTRRTIEEMLSIAGWQLVELRSQTPILTPEFEDLRTKLDAANLEYSIDDLTAPGWYVIARN
ncbi:MAG: class I SAM-dependent methyltransferase, partial [Thermoanaerobaculia bacterium]